MLKMKIATVILNYNDSTTTTKLLNKIKEYKILNKIIIVDNNSTDNSYQELKKYESEKIDVIKNDTNKGYASGNNFGAFWAIKKYGVQYILIANPDIEFDEITVKKIINELEKGDKYAIGTAKMFGQNNSWKLPKFTDNVASMFLGISKIKEKIRRLHEKKKMTKHEEVDVVAGSFFIIKSEVFKKIHGFCEDTFLYCEENILAKKLKDEGYKTIILNDCTYYHYHSISIKKAYSSKIPPFKIYCNSVRVYNDFLKINKFEKIIFEIFYYIAYVERICYDFIIKRTMRRE